MNSEHKHYISINFIHQLGDLATQKQIIENTFELPIN